MQTFVDQLSNYRSEIDQAIDKHIASQKSHKNGRYADQVRDVFFSMLGRGGKRIRGALVMVGYEMLGGKNADLALRAAVAIELMHAYILVIDDIQDRSDIRRGGPTAHKQLEKLSKDSGWRGEHAHTGLGLALNAALIGAHSAQNMFASLDVDPALRKKVALLMNDAMIMTAYGQTGDIVNEIAQEVAEKDIERVLEQKTAYYTILNPLQIGMILAGATDEELRQVESYAMAVGRAFQMSDDLLLFEDSSDKDPSGDIKEGKLTILTHYALDKADKDDARFLREELGNRNISSEQFEQCKEILRSSGAENNARVHLRDSISAAVAATQQFPSKWDSLQVDFLRNLAEYLGNRKN